MGDFFSLKKNVDAVRAYMLAGEPKLAVAVVKQFEEDEQLGRAAVGFAMLNEAKKAEQIIKTLIAEGATNDQLQGAKYALRYLEDERALQVADRLHLAQGEYCDAEYVYDEFGKKISAEMKLRCADALFAKGDRSFAVKLYEEENVPVPSDCWVQAGDALCANMKDYQLEAAVAAYTNAGAADKLLALGKQLLECVAQKTFPKLKVMSGESQRYDADGLRSFASACFKNAAELMAASNSVTENA
jgi:tetratricopeptide (TPR) repeat protein